MAPNGVLCLLGLQSTTVREIASSLTNLEKWEHHDLLNSQLIPHATQPDPSPGLYLAG